MYLKSPYYINFSEKTASIASRLEIIGPIPIDDSCQFLVLMSCGLCKTLKELHANDVQQFIRSIVQQVSTKTEQYTYSQNFKVGKSPRKLVKSKITENLVIFALLSFEGNNKILWYIQNPEETTLLQYPQ